MSYELTLAGSIEPLTAARKYQFGHGCSLRREWANYGGLARRTEIHPALPLLRYSIS